MRNNRLQRREPRTMDDEEAMWFDGEDDFEEADSVMPMTDVLKTKLDSEFEQLSKFLDRSRTNGNGLYHAKGLEYLFEVKSCALLFFPFGTVIHRLQKLYSKCGHL